MTIEAENTIRRAGFWRRIGSLLLDAVVVLLPLQVVVAVLFALTNGQMQGRFGLNLGGCDQLSQLPPGLQTQVENPNGVQTCTWGFPGLPTSKLLVVSRSETEGALTSTVSESFWLDKDGQLADRAGYDVSWIALLLLVVYMVVLEIRRGRTIGDRIMRIRVVDPARPEVVGLPAARSIGRRLAYWIGAVPAAVVNAPILYYRYDVAKMSAYVATPAYRYGSYIALAAAAAWLIWIMVTIVRKRDPIYDRLARTAVIRG